MKRAMFIKTIPMGSGDALHYKLSDPIEYKLTMKEIKKLKRNLPFIFDNVKKMKQKTNNKVVFTTNDVIISAVVTKNKGIEEVKMFASDPVGNIITYNHISECENTLDHEEVLLKMKYQIM